MHLRIPNFDEGRIDLSQPLLNLSPLTLNRPRADEIMQLEDGQITKDLMENTNFTLTTTRTIAAVYDSSHCSVEELIGSNGGGQSDRGGMPEQKKRKQGAAMSCSSNNVGKQSKNEHANGHGKFFWI